MQYSRGDERYCVVCKHFVYFKKMRFNNQYIDRMDNVCNQCFKRAYAPKQSGKHQISKRVIRFGTQGEERRCSQCKQWTMRPKMALDSSYSDGLSTSCQECKDSRFVRKVPKSIRTHYFGGRKIKQKEIDGLKDKYRISGQFI